MRRPAITTPMNAAAIRPVVPGSGTAEMLSIEKLSKLIVPVPDVNANFESVKDWSGLVALLPVKMG